MNNIIEGLKKEVEMLTAELAYEKGKNETYKIIFNQLNISIIDENCEKQDIRTVEMPNDDNEENNEEGDDTLDIISTNLDDSCITSFDFTDRKSPINVKSERLKNKKIYTNAPINAFVSENELSEHRINITKSYIENQKKCDCFSNKKNIKTKEKIVDRIKTYILFLKKTMTPYKEKEIINDVKSDRQKIAKYLTLDEYANLINFCIQGITSIYKSKKYIFSRINQLIIDGFTSLELRLVKHNDYTRTTLDPNDIFVIDHIIEYQIRNQTAYKVTPYSYFQIKLNNYGTNLFQIMKTIKRYIINPYGFQEFIYLKTDTKQDVLFYKLKKNSSNLKRYWELDFCLDKLTNILSNYIIQFLSYSYRDIYKDVYGDNVYHAEIISSNVLELECEQIMQNIIFVLYRNNLNMKLRNLIKNNSIHKITTNDYFDSFDNKQYTEYLNTDEDNILIIKSLYDSNISDQTSRDIYYNTVEKIKHIL
jgi:hypothetical protein